MNRHRKCSTWVGRSHIGRKYERLIRINSQSGKGGVTYVLEHEFGIYPPKSMQPLIGAAVQKYADAHEGELNEEELLDIFNKEFVNITGVFALKSFSRIVPPANAVNDGSIYVHLEFNYDCEPVELEGRGNGPISACVDALRNSSRWDFILEDFSERTLGTNADAEALAFVGIRRKSDNTIFYGAGRHSNIDQAAILALFSALNKATPE